MYSRQEILKMEREILAANCYRLHYPTPSEILKLLLFIASPKEDFSSVVATTNQYIFKALLGSQH